MKDQPADSGAAFVIGQATFRAPLLEPALYLVATPIGNLSDITVRALEVLAACDVLACEDTRTTRVLLGRYGISRRASAYHEHNAETAGPRLIEAVARGQSVALVSDAGTPLVSDPGFRLVARAREAGLRVVPIPGASSVLAALTASALPTDSFFFAGFLPSAAGRRRERLEALKGVDATLVFFESPRRLAQTLAAMAQVFGARAAVVARELTKLHEEIVDGTTVSLAERYADAGAPKGEVVICVAGPEPVTAGPEEIDRLLRALVAEMPASKAAAEAARMTGGKKRDLYERLLAFKNDAGEN